MPAIYTPCCTRCETALLNIKDLLDERLFVDWNEVSSDLLAAIEKPQNLPLPIAFRGMASKTFISCGIL